VGVLVAIIAAAIRWQFLEILELRATFLTFYPAVAVAALYGGLGAGLLATFVSAALADYFWIEPVGQFGITNSADLISMAVFLASGALISYLAEAAYRAQAQAHKAEEQSKLAAEREKAAVDLQQSESKYRELVQNANSVIIRWKRDGTLTFFNEYAQKFFGYSAEEVIGKSVNILVPEQSTGGDLTGLLQDIVNHPERYVNNINENILRDGSRVWMAWTNKPIFDQEGQVVEILAVASDITERKRAEALLQLQAELLYLSYDAIIVWQLEGRIETWNKGAEELYGYSKEEAVGQVTHDLLKTIHPEPWPQLEGKLRERKSWEGELKHSTREGREVIVSARHQLVRGADGVERVLETNRDITERKRAEEEVRRNRQWLEITLSSIGDAVIATDASGRVTFLNPIAAQMTGWRLEEALRQPIQSVFQIINEKTRKPAENIVEHVLLEGNIVNLANHTALITRDGREIPIEDSAAPIRDKEGGVSGVVLVFHDVTEKRRAREALRESEERLRLFIGHAPASLAMFDRSMRYLSASRRWLTEHGLEQTDLTGLSHYEVFPEIPEYWKEVHRRGLTGEVVRVDADRFDRADGSVLWLRWEVWPWHDGAGDVGGIVIFSEDITEFKKQEEELRRLNRILRALSNTNQAAIHAEDVSDFLDAVCRIIVEDCGHPMVWIGFAEDDENRTVKPVAQAGFEEGYLETIKITWSDTELGRGPTGTAIRTGTPDVCRNMLTETRMRPWREHAIKRGYASSAALPLKTDGHTSGVLTIYSKDPDSFPGDEVKLLAELADDLAYGITVLRLRLAHQQSEKKLRESQARLDLALRSASMGTWHWDITENRRYFDDQACYLLGIDPTMFTGAAEDFFKVLHPDDRETVMKALARTLERDVPYETEYRVAWPDGGFHYIASRGKLVRDDEGLPVKLNGLIWDISERRHMEEELRKSRDDLELRVRERTAELSATVARLELVNAELQEFAFVASHDLQEPLRKIQTFCDMAKKRCAPVLDNTSQEYLDRVINSASRMRQLLSDLLQFSRVAAKQEPFETIDLVKIVREAADVFEKTVKNTGALVDIESMPTIEADESQMLRLFQNLIGNALKFRSNGIPNVKVYGKLVGRGLCEILIEDNGIGFDPKFAELIFKPFQRLHNRNEYEGTGMGLAICRKIIERHGGSIRAESEPGKGSTFIIRLPVKQDRWEGI
jgi:PAS domain S-box-containing protein